MTAIVIRERPVPLQLRADYQALPESLIGRRQITGYAGHSDTGNHLENREVIKYFGRTRETIINHLLNV